MPVFSFKGVDLQGKIRKGHLFAPSIQMLDESLLRKEIALLRARTTVVLHINRINRSEIILFFEQLSQLLDSGMLLSQALECIALQAESLKMGPILYDLHEKVSQGISLHKAMEDHPIFSPMICQLIEVGLASHNLIFSLNVIVSHLIQVQEFSKAVRKALFGPFLTFIFFFVIAAVIFLGVLPQFASLYAGMGKEMPTYLNLAIKSSRFFSSWQGMGVIGITLSFFVCMWIYFDFRFLKNTMKQFFMLLPSGKKIFIRHALSGYFNALSLLLKGGVHLAPALEMAATTIGHNELKMELIYVARRVAQGDSFGAAFSDVTSITWVDTTIPLMALASQSDNLKKITHRVALNYQEEVTLFLTRLSHFIQPLVFLILGLLVMGLILAVWGPIFSYSLAINP